MCVGEGDRIKDHPIFLKSDKSDYYFDKSKQIYLKKLLGTPENCTCPFY